MQHSLVMSGIGGQGIVVGTMLIGHAATRTDRYCLHYASYGGEMRGTKCECSMTVSDEPVDAPPLVSRPDIAIIMHPESFKPLTPTITPGGLGLINSSLIDPASVDLRDDIEWLFLPVTDVGKDIGHVMVATMVAIAAFSVETGLADVSDIRDALTDVIPAYRHHLLEMDDQGLKAGVKLAEKAAQTVVERGADGAIDAASIPTATADRCFRVKSTVDYIFANSGAALA